MKAFGNPLGEKPTTVGFVKTDSVNTVNASKRKKTGNRKNIHAMTLVTAVALALSGCSTISSLTKKEEVHRPAKLVKLTQSMNVLQPVLKTDIGVGKFAKTDPLRMQVAYDGLNVFLASRKGHVRALNINGKKLWAVDVGNEITGGVAYDKASHTLVVSTRSGEVFALDNKSGRVKWREQLTGTVLAPAVISKNRVMLSANDGFLHGLNLDNGQPIWKFVTQVPDISIRGTAKPILLDDSHVLFATADGRVHLLAVESGEPIWSRSIGIASGASDIERMSDVDGTPALYDGTLYAVSYSGELTGIRMSDRKVVFFKKIASLHSPAVSRNLVVVSTLDGKLVAFDRNTGKLKWQNSELLYRNLSNPVVVGRYVVVGDYDGVIHLLDSSTGKIVSRNKSKGSINHLQVIGNRLVTQSKSGEVSIWKW